MPLNLPSWLRWYRKPSYRDFKTFTQTINADIEQGVTSRAPSIISQSDDTIPASLTLDRVLANKTCSPLSLYDFYMYLKHIELSPENLEFYIWFRDYERRHREDAKSSFQEAPVHDTTKLLSEDKNAIMNVYSTIIPDAQLLREEALGPEFARYLTSIMPSQHGDHSTSCQSCKRGWQLWSTSSPSSSHTTLLGYSNKQELQAMAAYFLTPQSPMELNLPDRMRRDVCESLLNSDSPEALAPVVNHVYYLLKNCSHRNFIRLGVKNGTFETLCMVTVVGITFIALGLLTMLLVAFASPSIHHSVRWRGLAAAPFWIIGFSFMFAGLRGSCFLLLLFTRRQELPWERIQNEKKAAHSPRVSALMRFFGKLMISERKIRVNDRGLRNLQHKIVIQSVIGSIIAMAIIEVVFLCLPIWK
ncbi:uncharacterized protein A1O9_10851 [Exophiala aquamarina CBS 119918]|uniref:RGS domain-containing protein n=1 Tax=Exophiala aquamarina CBS 119918 TaxID=1182545 RepID=A0A072PBJ9_9EURO|nr:uncharacterized protein A1O9_10851 [Exophiala aquamarina CBS 119918]KEF52945.1 hypothetical protein A1O9_10851 [Exophiala aquamarina CBS 119918]